MPRRRPRPAGPHRAATCRVPPGYGDRYVLKVRSGTGETRLRSLVSKDRSYKPMVKSDGAQRESDGVVVCAERRVVPSWLKSSRTVPQAGSVAKGGGNASPG